MHEPASSEAESFLPYQGPALSCRPEGLHPRRRNPYWSFLLLHHRRRGEYLSVPDGSHRLQDQIQDPSLSYPG